MFGRPPLSKTPLLIPAIAVIIGVWLGSWLPLWVAAVPLLAAVIFIVLRNHYSAAISIIALASFSSAYFQIPRTYHIPLNKHLTFSAKIQEISTTNTGSALRLKIDSVGSNFSVLKPVKTTRAVVYTSIFPDNLQNGSKIIFSTKFEACTTTRDIPLETDPNDFLLRNHIFISAILAPSSIRKIYPPSGLQGWLSYCLNHFRFALFRSNLSTRNISFLNTIITGDTSTLLSSDRQIFSSAGLAHILALSGMHVALIAWIITFALWPLKFSGRLWPSSIITLIFLWAYAIATGMSPSVMRAVIMATFFSIAHLTYRLRGGMNSLCGAVIAILIIWPDSLTSIGFQMSVTAVAAIIMFANPLNPISTERKSHRNFFNLLSVPLAAMIGTSIVAAFYFHSLPVYFIFSNLLSSILLLPTMVCGIFTGLTQLFGFSLPWLLTITSWLCDAIFYIADFFATLPGSSVNGLWIPLAAIIPTFIALILFRFWLEYKSRQWLFATLTLAASAAALILFMPRPQPLNGVLLPSTLKSTTIIYTNSSNKSLSVVALASSNFKEDLSRLANTRYSEYTTASRLDSIHVSTTLSASQFLYTISAHCNTPIALLTPDSLITNSPAPTTLLITHNPKSATLLDTVSTLPLKTILISAAIPPKSAERLASKLQNPQRSIKYIRSVPHFFENP